MFFLYNFLLLMFFPFFVIFIAFSLIFVKKWRKGIFKKFGFYKRYSEKEKNHVIHCVSVGETLSAVPFVKKFTESHRNVIFTVTTKTGYDIAVKNVAKFVRDITFFPYDFPFAVNNFFDALKPEAVIIFETELWPNVIFFARKQQIPVIFINGRISDRSFPNYVRFRKFFEKFLDYPFFLMQTERDKERILSLGAKASQVFVTGNIKYDLEKTGKSIDKKELGLKDNDIVLIAGSTHAGEELAVIRAFKKLKESFKTLKLIVAPRHPERFDEVATIIEMHELSYTKRSKQGKIEEVFLLDTVGELFDFYGISDIAFVGGSLVNIGGHNIIEPASYGIPVIFGPYMQNFKDISDEFVAQKAGISVSSEKLDEVLLNLLSSEQQRKQMGLNAKEITIKNRGSLEKTLKLVEFITGK